MDEVITYRLGLSSLDSAGATYKFGGGGVGQHLVVQMDKDRFVSLDRPGHIVVTVEAVK